MTTRTHLLEIYDAEGYRGSNPVKVRGIGLVRGPEGQQYYVVEPAEPIFCDDNPIRQLAIRCHYNDPAARMEDSTCTVGIALSPTGEPYVVGQQYGFADFVFWRVGKIQRCEGEC